MRKQNHFKVQDFKAWVNEQLKETSDEVTDEFKKGLCEALEQVLKQCHWDIEFTYNYWVERGLIEFQQAGSPSTGTNTKQQFILGPSGQEYNRNYQ